MELVRQLLTARTVFDRDRRQFVSISDVNILAVTTSPGLPGLLHNWCSFYRAMHFSAKHGIAIACRLSVRLSVCLFVCDVGGL